MRRGKKRSTYAQRPRAMVFMGWVKTLPCAARSLGGTRCRGEVEADHAGSRAMGQKAEDRTCIPLCTDHHVERHALAGTFAKWTRAAMREWLASTIAETQQLAHVEGVSLDE